MNTQEFWLVSLFIIIEFSLVTLFIVGCFAARTYFLAKKRKSKALMDQIVQTLSANKKLPEDAILHPKELLLAFETLSHTPPLHWEQTSKSIIKNQLLPKLRRYANDKNWEKRYLLLSAYDYHMNPQDNKILIKLIDDPIPVISFNAIRLSATSASKNVLKAILMRLKHESHPFHAFVIENISQNPFMDEVIIELLQDSDDPWLRKICYDFTVKMAHVDIPIDILKSDIKSTNLNLQVAATRALPFVDKDAYLAIYEELLSHPAWQVRNAVVKALREKIDPKAIDLLAKTLTDTAWWVRTNAAKTLTFYGEEGRLILTEFKATELSYHEEAEYFLTIQKVREQ